MNDYYNESKYYVKRDKESLDNIESLRRDYLLVQKLEDATFSYELKYFHKYIRIICDFLDGFNLNNPVEYSIALSYLIDNGYLSITPSFDKSRTKFDYEMMSHPAISIILGEGCCRNYADFHNVVMKRLGLKSRRFFCIQSNSKLKKSGENRTANHVANTIYHNGKIYVVDIFNCARLYSFINEKEASQIHDSKEGILTYKPYVELVLNESNLDMIKSQYKNQDISASIPSICYDEYYNGIRINTLNKMGQKQSQIESFDKSTMDIKKTITKELVMTKK